MKIRITIRLTPESRGEMIDKFGLLYREFREHVEALQARGMIPPDAEIRWLLDSGRWE